MAGSGPADGPATGTESVTARAVLTMRSVAEAAIVSALLVASAAGCAGASLSASSAENPLRGCPIPAARCVTPRVMRSAYSLNRLLRAGGSGRGQSIVLVESFGSPTIRTDLARFDATFDLPPPPKLVIDSPFGTAPFDSHVSGMAAWAQETSLNVEWVHVVAPDAEIVVLTTPEDETEGTIGLGALADLESFALDHHLGDVISQSWATPETTLESPAGRTMIARFDSIYRQAEAEDVSVVSAAGDVPGEVQFPASSPLVTAVGASKLLVTSSGAYLGEQPWSGTLGGTGGGYSSIFSEPGYQLSGLVGAEQAELAGRRGVPDVTWDGSASSAVPIYVSFPGSANGLTLAWGTSLSAPEWAGLAADIDQLAGHPVGLLNPYLYRIGGRSGAFKPVGGEGGGDGWSDLTGWGSPVAWRVAEKVAALAHIPAASAGTTPAAVAGPSAR